jgi:hypothetical protein
MHSLRSSLRAREAGGPARPLSLEERRRESAGGEPPPLPKGERRQGDRRRQPRHHGIVEQAAILYRGKKAMMPVANVSESGLTLDTGLVPEIGETMLVELAGGPPVEATVCWVKKGRVGLSLG